MVGSYRAEARVEHSNRGETGTLQEQVVLPAGVDSEPEKPTERLAVFVTHGMGQQVPFSTVSDLVTELQNEPPFSGVTPVTQTVLLGDQRLQRISLQLPAGREIHFYEGYWAPLTAGVVTLRDVLRFLLQAGINGLRNNEGVFRRWAFGGFQVYDIPVRTWVYLAVAVATVGALVSMNTVISVVTLARATLGQRPQWLTDRLFEDLTITLDIFLLAVVAFGMTLLAAGMVRRIGRARPLRWVTGWLSVLTFVVAVFAAIIAGVILPALLMVHGRAASLAGPPPSFWGYLLGNTWPSTVSTVSTTVLEGFFVLLALWILGRPWPLIYRTFRGQLVARWKETESDQQQPIASVLVLLLFGILLAFVITAAFKVWRFSQTVAGGPHWSIELLLTWIALLGVSAVVRYFLVQYVGDVAVYVSAHTIDRFAEVRQQIRDCVYAGAQAVYGASGEAAYDAILLVGHSLGSVVSYDVLNRLINEEQLQRPGPSDVVRRTRLLLTFGSPLDKTAYIFSTQTGRINPIREALAASTQPLVQDYRFRGMSWINIYSPWDIISGALKYYDKRGTASPPAIGNLLDPDATTLLAAHTEYWHNPLLRRVLAKALTS
jgi:hypothetical protein